MVSDDYITKPFSATYLQARVENLLMQALRNCKVSIGIA